MQLPVLFFFLNPRVFPPTCPTCDVQCNWGPIWEWKWPKESARGISITCYTFRRCGYAVGRSGAQKGLDKVQTLQSSVPFNLAFVPTGGQCVLPIPTLNPLTCSPPNTSFQMCSVGWTLFWRSSVPRRIANRDRPTPNTIGASGGRGRKKRHDTRSQWACLDGWEVVYKQVNFGSLWSIPLRSVIESRSVIANEQQATNLSHLPAKQNKKNPHVW